MRVQKCRNERLLKPTETLAVLKIQNPRIKVTEDKDVKSDQIQTDAKIVLIKMKTAIPMYLCRKYNYMTDCCNSCKIVALQSQYKENFSVKMNVLDSEGVKYQISTSCFNWKITHC